MARGKPVSVEKRASVITLHSEGYSERVIAEKLKIPKSTVHDVIQRYQRTGTYEDRERPGPSRQTSKIEDRHIALISRRNRRLTAPEIAAEFNRDRLRTVSVSTVQRRLREANLHGRIATRKPLLRRGNKQKRLHWAKSHKNWTVEDFKKVLWSDESKFEIFGNRRRVFVRRSADERMLPECLIPTVKHGGGSVLVWGCFSYAGTGDLVKIDGIMKKEEYRRILEHNAVPSGLRLIGRGFQFMHDNDPKHTSKVCKEYLKLQENCRNLSVMIWPPQSPDINPIELLWDEVDRRVRTKCPTSKTEMWNCLSSEWNNIQPEILENLIARMPRIVKAVIAAKGGFFDERKV